MKPFRRILVPIDYSPDSERALTLAECLARLSDAEMVLFHVVEHTAAGENELSLTPPTEPIDHKVLGGALDELQKLGSRLLPASVRWTTGVGLGKPAQEIVEAAGREKADLIVLGTKGKTGLAHILAGSVAERVVRTATCPVLTVRRP